MHDTFRPQHAIADHYYNRRVTVAVVMARRTRPCARVCVQTRRDVDNVSVTRRRAVSAPVTVETCCSKTLTVSRPDDEQSVASVRDRLRVVVGGRRRRVRRTVFRARSVRCPGKPGRVRETAERDNDRRRRRLRTDGLLRRSRRPRYGDLLLLLLLFGFQNETLSFAQDEAKRKRKRKTRR